MILHQKNFLLQRVDGLRLFLADDVLSTYDNLIIFKIGCMGFTPFMYMLLKLLDLGVQCDRIMCWCCGVHTSPLDPICVAVHWVGLQQDFTPVDFLNLMFPGI